jgi:hypothetical protein
VLNATEFGLLGDEVPNACGGADCDTYGLSDSEMRRWGIGVVQEIDAAAMSVWLAWRHHEASVTCTNSAGEQRCDDVFGSFGEHDLDDVEIVKFGGLINF